MFISASLALLLGWAIYFTSGQQSTLLLIVLIIGNSLFLYFKFKLSFDDWKEASNVVTAAYTYSKLSPGAQEAVRDRTRQILAKSGWRREFSRVEENEPVLYGWYALAMAELGIPSQGILDTWNYVSNPFYVNPKSKQYAIALKQIKRKTGADVYIDPVDHHLEDLRK